jgi:hypothetical protein
MRAPAAPSWDFYGCGTGSGARVLFRRDSDTILSYRYGNGAQLFDVPVGKTTANRFRCHSRRPLTAQHQDGSAYFDNVAMAVNSTVSPTNTVALAATQTENPGSTSGAENIDSTETMLFGSDTDADALSLADAATVRKNLEFWYG